MSTDRNDEKRFWAIKKLLNSEEVKEGYQPREDTIDRSRPPRGSLETPSGSSSSQEEDKK